MHHCPLPLMLADADTPLDPGQPNRETGKGERERERMRKEGRKEGK